ncbi:hypothetical protein NHX12_013051 [Muraenolepis orangiensis]|uniref:Uncharacterized protein n=1 Tax=Muraenolepis orangiensis TaxID=630683 RepID=A0A9Q0DGP0_9TELE|nr:hypothetical protein NHX12_013051 [Muraenolepis orangiensis]
MSVHRPLQQPIVSLWTGEQNRGAEPPGSKNHRGAEPPGSRTTGEQNRAADPPGSRTGDSERVDPRRRKRLWNNLGPGPASRNHRAGVSHSVLVVSLLVSGSPADSRHTTRLNTHTQTQTHTHTHAHTPCTGTAEEARRAARR